MYVQIMYWGAYMHCLYVGSIHIVVDVKTQLEWLQHPSLYEPPTLARSTQFLELPTDTDSHGNQPNQVSVTRSVGNSRHPCGWCPHGWPTLGSQGPLFYLCVRGIPMWSAVWPHTWW